MIPEFLKSAIINLSKWAKLLECICCCNEGSFSCVKILSIEDIFLANVEFVTQNWFDNSTIQSDFLK
jgi:hypothetical protein